MSPEHSSDLVLTKFNENEESMWLYPLWDSGLFKAEDKVFNVFISATSSVRKKLLNSNEMLTSDLSQVNQFILLKNGFHTLKKIEI